MDHSENCIFCQMISNRIQVPRIYEDETVISIRDIRPQAKTHLLIIPKEHVSSLDSVFPEQCEGNPFLIGKLFSVATKVARQQGLLPGGFRSVINTGKDSGQTVFHLHLHILGGEELRGNFG